MYNQSTALRFITPKTLFRRIPELISVRQAILVSIFCSAVALGQRTPTPLTSPSPEPPPATPAATAPAPSVKPPGGEAKPGGEGVPSGAPVDSKTYKVGPEDVLYIRVWHETDFTGPVAVHSDGKFTLPLIGDMQAGGLTPSEIERTVTEALQKYVVKPLVTVVVQEVRSKKYFLDGAVARPGEYPLAAPTTVFEALSKAGGFQEFANEKKIYILRGTKRIPFNYRDVIRGKRMDQNILLESDDHVVVP